MTEGAPAMSRMRQSLLLIATFLVLYCVLAYGFYEGIASRVPGANDYFSRWLGAREFFLRGIDPYSDAATQQIQIGMYGRLARSDFPRQSSGTRRDLQGGCGVAHCRAVLDPNRLGDLALELFNQWPIVGEPAAIQRLVDSPEQGFPLRDVGATDVEVGGKGRRAAKDCELIHGSLHCFAFTLFCWSLLLAPWAPVDPARYTCPVQTSRTGHAKPAALSVQELAGTPTL